MLLRLLLMLLLILSVEGAAGAFIFYQLVTGNTPQTHQRQTSVDMPVC